MYLYYDIMIKLFDIGTNIVLIYILRSVAVLWGDIM